MKLFDIASIAMTDSPQPAANPQDNNPPAAGAESSSQSAEKKKGGCAKWGCGCGCISVVGLIVLLVIGGGIALWQAPRAVGAESWGETVEMLDGAQALASGASGGLTNEPADLNRLSKSSDPEEREEFEQAVGGLNDFFDSLDATTISSRDINGVKSHLEDWGDDRSVKRFYDVFERLEKLEQGDESIITGLKSLRGFVQLAFRANDLGKAYNEHFQDRSDADRNAHNQVVAITRLSQFSVSNNHKPWDQEVADALIKDHDENRESYEQGRDLFRAAVEDPNFDPDDLSEEEQQQLAEAFTNQFLMFTSAIDRDSLQNWSRLSAEERQEIIEEIDKPHNLIARLMAGTVHATEDEAHLFYVRLLGF